MQNVLAFDSSTSAPKRRPRPTKACLTCRNRRVKCDCLHPICSECRKRQLVCTYQHAVPTATSSNTVEPTPTGNDSVEVLPVQTDAGVHKAVPGPEAPRASCQFATESLSMLAVEDEITSTDFDFIRDFDRQMARLNLEDVPSDEIFSILQSLPSYEDCSRLYQAFEYGVHPVVPVCHLPSLEETMRTFWGDNNIATSGDTLALILSIVYCGLTSLNDERYTDATRSIYDSYNRLLHILEFPNDITKAKIPLLQSYLLVNSCRATQFQPFSSFGFLSPAVRIAQALKINLERKSLPTIEKETYRRIWWHLIYMDVEAALMSGLPFLIHEDDYNTCMPCPLDDASIVNKNDPGPGAVHARSPAMLAMHGRWQWAILMRTARRRKPSDKEFDDFVRGIDNLLAEVSTHPSNAITSTAWSQSYLRLHIERAVCSAARSFLDEGSVTGIVCDHRLLRSCRKFLHEYIQLTELCEQKGCQWFLPGFVHPLQAMMILLLHLTRCPALHYEETLQSKELLTETFAIVGNRLQRGRVVSLQANVAIIQNKPEKVSLVYCLLAKLRYRVWTRADWGIPSQAGQGCPLDNLYEAINYANVAEEPLTWQNHQLEPHMNGEKQPHTENSLVTEHIEEDSHQYDDLFEQFLQPGVLA